MNGRLDFMKHLEFYEAVYPPQLSPIVLGIGKDDFSCLAIGMFSEDDGYCWPGDARAISGTITGNLGRISEDC
jgi:hypothetical protein